MAKDHNERIAAMSFAATYPYYVAKIEKKGRSIDELHRVIEWLTGIDAERLKTLIEADVTFAELFDQTRLNAHAHLITGVICGYRVEEIENPLTQKVRYLDKLIDELAKGKPMEKILRTPKE